MDQEEFSNKETLLLETSTVRWHELQRLFAAGRVLSIAEDLDLIEIADMISNDDAEVVGQLISDNKIQHVTNDQARAWYDVNALLWAVVVKPWVLVQDRDKS